MEEPAGREEVRAALGGHVGFGVRRSATVGTEYLYCAVPLAPPRDSAAVLRLAEPLEVVGHLGESLTRVSTASAALAVLVSILVLAYVSGRFARRLLRLQAVARRIGEGDTAVRAPEAPRDDLANWAAR
jgi:two-component system phosphate regulon sensor histidine kinase PhoR